MALMLLILLVGGLLAFAAIGWFSRQPAFLSGGWRAPVGLLATGLLFAGLLLSWRGGWIAGAPLAALAVVLGLVARMRPERRNEPTATDRLSKAEARSLLGVGPLATPAEIRAAHARLIRMNHPDAGGTDGLAAQLNAARDLLLGR